MELCAHPAAVLGVAVLVDEEDAEGSAWPAVVGTLPVEISSFCGAFVAE